MKGEKYHIYLSTKERNEIVASLINLKNKLIEQGRYTDLVDEIMIKLQKQTFDGRGNSSSCSCFSVDRKS
ncbi:MAG: hypothetical protein U0N38_09915 [Acutalibacteraceae bacterium]